MNSVASSHKAETLLQSLDIRGKGISPPSRSESPCNPKLSTTAYAFWNYGWASFPFRLLRRARLVPRSLSSHVDTAFPALYPPAPPRPWRLAPAELLSLLGHGPHDVIRNDPAYVWDLPTDPKDLLYYSARVWTAEVAENLTEQVLAPGWWSVRKL